MYKKHAHYIPAPGSSTYAFAQKMKNCFFLCLLFLVITQSSGQTFQPIGDFSVRGTVKTKSIRFSTERSDYYYESLTNEFEVYVSGGRWLVKLGTDDPAVYDYRVVSSDGEDTYLLLNYETRLKQSTQPLPNIGDGVILKGSIPCFGIAEEAGAVWLTYAARSHFSENAQDDRRAVPFVTYVRPSPITRGEGLAVENARWLLNDKSPHFPETVTYSVNDLAAEGFDVSHNMSSGHAFTNVYYRVLSFVDNGGFQFPNEATVQIYRPNPKQKQRVEAQLCQEFQLTAINITLGQTLGLFRPILPGKTIVNDRRFDKAGVLLAYFVTNKWLDESVVQASRGYKAALVKSPPIESRVIPRGIVILAVILLTSLPVVLWLKPSQKQS